MDDTSEKKCIDIKTESKKYLENSLLRIYAYWHILSYFLLFLVVLRVFGGRDSVDIIYYQIN